MMTKKSLDCVPFGITHPNNDYFHAFAFFVVFFFSENYGAKERKIVEKIMGGYYMHTLFFKIVEYAYLFVTQGRSKVQKK